MFVGTVIASRVAATGVAGRRADHVTPAIAAIVTSPATVQGHAREGP